MDFWHMEQGDEYPVPRDVLTPAWFAGGEKIYIRLVLDLATGKGRFYHPRDPAFHFPIDIGIPPVEGLYISLRTNSLAVGVDNFRVTYLEE